VGKALLYWQVLYHCPSYMTAGLKNKLLSLTHSIVSKESVSWA
jgi:hypothetical protein